MKSPQRRAWIVGGATAAVAAGLGFAVWRRGPTASAALPAHNEPQALDLWAQRFEQPSGGELVMADLRGRPLLLNFWATWCAPCIAEMPMLDTFQHEYASRGWRVVGLAVDNPEPVRDFVNRRKLGFSIGLVGFAGSEIARELGNSSGSLPFSVVFDRQGKIQHRKLGAIKPEDLVNWVNSVG